MVFKPPTHRARFPNQGYATLFNSTISRNTVSPPWTGLLASGVLPFGPPPALPRGYLLKPVSRLEELTITWQLPGMRSAAQLVSKPLSYASFILGSEHEGSLLLRLIELGWANQLAAGPSIDEDALALFQVTIHRPTHVSPNTFTPSNRTCWTKSRRSVFL